MPCVPLFHERTGWAESFFAGCSNWYSYKSPAKNFFSGTCCLEYMPVTPTALMRPDRSKQCLLSALLKQYGLHFWHANFAHETIFAKHLVLLEELRLEMVSALKFVPGIQL